jgi:hypothetical protein
MFETRRPKQISIKFCLEQRLLNEYNISSYLVKITSPLTEAEIDVFSKVAQSIKLSEGNTAQVFLRSTTFIKKISMW